MIRLLTVYILAFFIFFLPHSGYTQNLTGTVVDSLSMEALPYATLVSRDLEMNVVGGTMADDLGRFKLPLAGKARTFEVSYLGYQPKAFPIPSQSKKDVFLKLVQDDSVLSLSEVVVEGRRTSREFLLDRKIIKLGDDIQASGGTILDAFEQLPEIETDPIENNVRLRGSGNVRILVNGKPSPLNNSDLLAQIEASQVDRVEIITAPSAKYQADGQSGIINIVLVDKVIKGIAGSVDLSGRTNPGYSAGANLTSGFGKVNLQGGVSYRDNFSLYEVTNQRQFPIQDRTQSVTSNSEFDGSVTNVSLKGDWFINSKNELSLSVKRVNNEHFIIPITLIREETGQETRNELVNYHEHLTSIYNLNYRRKFAEDKERYVDIDVNVNQNENTLPTQTSVDGVLVLENELFFDNYIINTAVDLSWEINNKTSFEAGGLYTQKNIDNVQLTSPPFPAEEQFYAYTENTHAAYFLMNHNEKTFGIQAGLRGEYFTSDGLINGQLNAIERTFFNIFPSLHLSYKGKEEWEYALSYNRRIARPSFYSLNPLTTINNLLFRREGNPELTPAFTDNIELGAHWNREKTSLHTNLFYRRNYEIMNQVFKLDEEGGTITTFVNGGKIQTVGLESTFTRNLQQKWDLSLTLSAYYHRAAPLIQDFFYRDLYNYNLRSKLVYHPIKDLSIDLQWNFFGNRRRLNVRSRAYSYANLALRYKTLKKKGTFTLRFTDMYRGNIYRNSRVSNQITESIVWRGQTRILILAFSYRFSKGDIGKRKRRVKNYNESGVLE